MKIVANKLEKDAEVVYSFQMTERTLESIFQKSIDVPNKRIEITFSIPLSPERMKLIHAYVDAVFRQIENNEYLNHTLTYKKLEIAMKLAEFYKENSNNRKIGVNSLRGFVYYGYAMLFSIPTIEDLRESFKVDNNDKNNKPDLVKLLILYHQAYSLESDGTFSVDFLSSRPSIEDSFFISPLGENPSTYTKTADFRIPGGRLGYIVMSLIFDTLEATDDKGFTETLIKSLGNKFKDLQSMSERLFPSYNRASSLRPVSSSSGAT